MVSAPLFVINTMLTMLYSDNSILFDAIKSCFNEGWIPNIWRFMGHPNIIFVVFLIFVVLCAIFLSVFLKELVCSFRNRQKDYFVVINNVLPEFALFVFTSGVVIYFIGYAYAGTAGNVLTLVLRSILSAFEMFLSKSNLIGIAKNCKESSIYMFCFALVHTLAVLVSMIFAVACFGKRIRHWVRRIVWRFSSSTNTLNVFLGLNEKSCILAESIYKSTGERIIFIDFPEEDCENKNGRSFSGILGLLSYKTNISKCVSDIKYLLLRSSISISEISAEDNDSFGKMDIKCLHRFIEKASAVNFFILTDNEETNLCAALNLLENKAGKDIDNIYCSKRKTKTAVLQEERHEKLHLIDDSVEAILELAKRKDEKGRFVAHPVNFVKVNTELGCVDAQFPFTSMIIGFGITGLEALRFLYEFSAFPDENGHKTPVKFIVCDDKVNSIKGDLYQEIPALSNLETCGEIEFCPYNTGTLPFYEKLHTIIDRLNYVVIATGDDSRNLNIANMICEHAIQYRVGGLNNFRIFVRLYNSDNEYKFKRVIETYAYYNVQCIEYFGAPRMIYTHKCIVDNEEAVMAEQFRSAYCKVIKESYLPPRERKKEEIINVKNILFGTRKYNRTVLQDKANYKHCYTKEVLLGLDKDKCIPSLPQWPITLNAGKNKDEQNWFKKLINVSICEHLRWNASHIMMGYMPMSSEEANAAVSTCDERSKKHLCLREWEGLKDLSRPDSDYQRYDYMVVLTTIKRYENNK